ncbi:MAG: methyltransferase domain-containing protein [Frankiaceae bacterium]|nr:methyltransferase domain-containing protein [Frankiaceae bacterium]MBV9368513.1 methyltransferase domain-containing protein [Frankiales bacterium]
MPGSAAESSDAGVETNVTGDAAFQSEVLEEMASAVNYRRWITGLAAPYLGDSPIEIGSGTGDYAELWADGVATFTATEGFPPLVRRLEERFERHPRVVVRELVAPVTDHADHSAVVAINVLEHIPDDVAALQSFANLVAPGGAVVVFVPAYPLLMSDYDRVVGHQRRYRRKTLAAAMRAADLDVIEMRHVNVIGFFGWLLLMRLAHGRPKDGRALTLFDRYVVPLLRPIEAAVAPPFGQSLFAVGQTRQLVER